MRAFVVESADSQPTVTGCMPWSTKRRRKPVRVNGRTVISRNDLAGGDALRQRFLAVGILNTPAGFGVPPFGISHNS